MAQNLLVVNILRFEGFRSVASQTKAKFGGGSPVSEIARNLQADLGLATPTHAPKHKSTLFLLYLSFGPYYSCLDCTSNVVSPSEVSTQCVWYDKVLVFDTLVDFMPTQSSDIVYSCPICRVFSGGEATHISVIRTL
jgi:hypothetical protein